MADIAVVDGEEKDKDRQHQQTLPHLLVLQVGIVVAQPVAILSYMIHEVKQTGKDQSLEIGDGYR